MNSGRILSIGSINVDIQVRAPRWPGPGETLIVDRFLMNGGGKAANVAYLARRLGAQAMLLGCVGDDDLAEQALEPLHDAGVDLEHVHMVAGERTGVALISVRERDADKAIMLANNANDAWPSRILRAAVDAVEDAPSGSILVLDLEIPPEVALSAALAAHEQGHTVILDPSPADRATPELLALCDAIVPSASDAEALTGVVVDDDPQRAIEAARVLRARGASAVFIELRSGGCVVVDDTTEEIVDVPQVDAHETTGAGDSFAGALAVALLEGASSVDAACFAAAVSSIAVTRWGSQQSYPTREELTHTC